MTNVEQFPRTGGKAFHISRVSFLGGAERVIVTLGEVLRAEGWDIVVACPGEGDLTREANSKGLATASIPIERTQITLDPRRLLRYATTLLRGGRFVEEFCRLMRIDVIHAHHPVGALYAIRACRNLGIPLVLHVHDALPARPLYSFALKRVLKHASRVVSCSQAGVDLVHSVSPSRHVDIVHNGLAPGFVEAAAEIAPADAGPGRHVGVFAQIETRKGQDVFLEAASKVIEKEPDTTFWLFGGRSSDKGGYADALEAKAKSGSLAGRVRFAGHTSDVQSWMKAMDVVVLPSVSNESLPMSLIEAMTLGRPCVATRIGGMAEIVDHGRTGLLVAPRDADALADAVVTLLGEDGPVMGEAASVTARSEFSGAEFARRIAGLYERSLDSVANEKGPRILVAAE
jgi:glycosyltransferase involved in cell wall biosynthesis